MKIIKVSEKPTFMDAILHSLAKNLIVKPSLKIQRSRINYPKFWTMPYDSICKEILIEGLYEKSIIEGMCQLVDNKKCVVLDVGANIGNHSMHFSTQFDQVISFEPSERNGWIFKANLELNNITNILFIEKGLSDVAGFIELGNDFNKLDTNNGFDPNAVLATYKINPKMIEIAIGDTEIESFNLTENIGMIKVDVEGLEPKVIKGLTGTIVKHKPIVFWEAFTSDTVNESRAALEEIGLNYFYHLSPAKPKGVINKVKGVFAGRTCSLVPLNDCTAYPGMNVASFKSLI
jgi:FkbM family methyltransferase